MLYENQGKEAALDHLALLEENGIDVTYYHSVLQNHIESMGERQIKKHEAERKRAREARQKTANDKVERKKMLYTSVQCAWPSLSSVAAQSHSAKQFSWAKQVLGLDNAAAVEPVARTTSSLNKSTTQGEAEDAFAQEDTT